MMNRITENHFVCDEQTENVLYAFLSVVFATIDLVIERGQLLKSHKQTTYHSRILCQTTVNAFSKLCHSRFIKLSFSLSRPLFCLITFSMFRFPLSILHVFISRLSAFSWNIFGVFLVSPETLPKSFCDHCLMSGLTLSVFDLISK